MLLASGCVGTVNTALPENGPNSTPASVRADVAPATQRSDIVIVPPAGSNAASMEAQHLDHHDDGRFVGISISGGGLRAANFAAAVLFELDRLGWLYRADYLSSVSGGGFPASIYCIALDGDWNKPRVRQQLGEDLTSVFLTGFAVQSPILMVSDRDRGDLLFDILNRRFFVRDGRTLAFADLRRDRPRLLINAANVGNGTRFVFCNESFDQLASDLASLPIGRAVAASAAHPVLFSPLALRDYRAKSPTFLHLADGGIADNLGVRTLYETYLAHVAPTRSSSRPVYPLGAVFIVIDARVHAENRVESHSDLSLLRSFVAGLKISAVSLVSGVSDATLAEILTDAARDDDSVAGVRARIAGLRADGAVRFTDRTGRDFVLLHLSLPQLGEIDDDEARRLALQAVNIPTDLRISRQQQDICWRAAEIIVHRRLEPWLRALEHSNDPAKP
jgi:predicted acylesterase/phospholipase RssA